LEEVGFGRRTDSRRYLANSKYDINIVLKNLICYEDLEEKQ